MKEIKFADGVRLTTKDGTTDYPDMTIFDHVKCTDEQRIEIIRNLMAFHRIDFTEDMDFTFIMEFYNDADIENIATELESE